MSGPTVGWIFEEVAGAGFQQILPNLLAIGEYNLTVAVGERDGWYNEIFGGYRIDLLADNGNTILSTVTGSTSPGGAGTFADVNLSYIATNSDPLGTQIGIRLTQLNTLATSHVDYDNIRLDGPLNVNPVPEPSSILLLGSALLVIIGFKRK